MATVDLSTPPPATTGLLDALPRRVALTLPELRLAAGLAGDAPLPFDLREPADAGASTGPGGLEGRLGMSRGSGQDEAYAGALASLHEPEDSLTKRGLVVDGVLDEGLAGALGLLATPDVAVDLDVAIDRAHAHAWHRAAGGAVATLATVDGIVFELAWFAAQAWGDELGRVAGLPEEVTLRGTALADLIDVPFELLDTASEAVRSGRSDLLPVLAAQHSGSATAQGESISDADLTSMLSALAVDSRGRLRALGADVSGDTTTLVGVVSWVLLADGWHSLHPHRDGDDSRVTIRRVEATDLSGDLAFVLSEVTA
jgi:hypothetical protein